MNICLVTTFPPSRGGLSEYGFHIARELQRNPFVNLTVLADKLSGNQPELDGFCVERCWAFDDPASLTGLWRHIRRREPDVVWFNLILSTFGRNPLAAFCGLTLPSLTRLAGFYTHVTLHHVMECVDLRDAGVRFPGFYRAAGALATKMLLATNSISVLIPGYRRILMEKYQGQNVHFRAHGIFSQYPEYPDFAKRNNPFQRILAFGKWGTYKKLGPIVEAFNSVAQCLPDAKLVIAGGDHPSAPGYVRSAAERLAGNSKIEFTGYVAEENVPDLFRSASIAVIPYSSSAGSSGVAHLACTYGVPIISVAVGDFREMAEVEGLAIDFYEAGNTQDLAAHIIRLLGSEARQREMAVQNFSAALRMTMPQIAYRYLRHFDLERRTRALKRIARFRQLAASPLYRGLFGRMITRNQAASIYPRDLFGFFANGQSPSSADGNGFPARQVPDSLAGSTRPSIAVEMQSHVNGNGHVNGASHVFVMQNGNGGNGKTSIHPNGVDKREPSTYSSTETQAEGDQTIDTEPAPRKQDELDVA